MELINKLIQEENESQFESWCEEHGRFKDDFEHHPDTGEIIANNKELLNESEYKEYIKEHKEDTVEYLLERFAESEEFEEFLFNKFMEIL